MPRVLASNNSCSVGSEPCTSRPAPRQLRIYLDIIRSAYVQTVVAAYGGGRLCRGAR